VADIAPDGDLTARQKRHFLIRMALRRVKPGTGSAPEFMKERTAMQPWPDLREVLRGIDWVIVGGVATRVYMPERLTKDLDILVRAEDREKAIEKLKQAGYHIISKLAVPGYQMRSPEGVDVDVLFGDYRWLDEALSHQEQDSAGYPVIGLPYLAMMKMEASRGRDLSDLYILLGWAEDDELDHVREAVGKYMPEEIEDIESVIFIGQHERKKSPKWDDFE
ncbi:MAG: nucleotidyltransferase family protein, partial [Chloroflexi bacterium]|nr:nucleotidyltransferase family protein [Chloroflexota bacterium]